MRKPFTKFTRAELDRALELRDTPMPDGSRRQWKQVARDMGPGFSPFSLEVKCCKYRQGKFVPILEDPWPAREAAVRELAVGKFDVMDIAEKTGLSHRVVYRVLERIGVKPQGNDTSDYRAGLERRVLQHVNPDEPPVAVEIARLSGLSQTVVERTLRRLGIKTLNVLRAEANRAVKYKKLRTRREMGLEART